MNLPGATPNLVAAFAASAAAHPTKPAILCGDLSLDYTHVAASAASLAERLRRGWAVKPGDRVGLWARNRPEFIFALLAILQTGAVAVPINTFLKADEVAFILQDAGVRVLVTDASLAEPRPALVRAMPGLGVLDLDALAEDDAASGSARLGAAMEPATSRRTANRDDLALVIYTSGTTGRPKGAMLTHGNLLHNVESCRLMLQAVDFDRFVLALPMFHSFMLCVCIFLPLLIGGSIVMVRTLNPAKALIEDLIRHQATILPGIPQLFRALASAAIPASLPLRLCVSGAAPLPVPVLQAFGRKFSFPLLEGYGLSEASPVVSLNPIAGPWKEGSIGLPVPGVEVSVQTDTGLALPPGEIGEICVRGGNVMRGYWNQPVETAHALRNGWLLTGDIGYHDADGYFYITDRKKDMLLVNGINVYPREIEEALYLLPEVQEAAVIGVADPRKGEQPVAYVVPADGQVLDEQRLLAHLRVRLADYKLPRRIRTVSALPHNATGKILKTTLREMESRQ